MWEMLIKQAYCRTFTLRRALDPIQSHNWNSIQSKYRVWKSKLSSVLSTHTHPPHIHMHTEINTHNGTCTQASIYTGNHIHQCMFRLKNNSTLPTHTRTQEKPHTCVCTHTRSDANLYLDKQTCMLMLNHTHTRLDSGEWWEHAKPSCLTGPLLVQSDSGSTPSVQAQVSNTCLHHYLHMYVYLHLA